MKQFIAETLPDSDVRMWHLDKKSVPEISVCFTVQRIL